MSNAYAPGAPMPAGAWTQWAGERGMADRNYANQLVQLNSSLGQAQADRAVQLGQILRATQAARLAAGAHIGAANMSNSPSATARAARYLAGQQADRQGQVEDSFAALQAKLANQRLQAGFDWNDALTRLRIAQANARGDVSQLIPTVAY